jgi:hypothetical protein
VPVSVFFSQRGLHKNSAAPERTDLEMKYRYGT